MPLRTVENPPNPFASTDVEYLEGQAPDARLRVLEDATRTLLSKNDSPDVGFTWSVNPYRGCWHACAYCIDGETPILMGDGRVKAMRDVRVGQMVYGTVRRGARRCYVRTPVIAHWRTVKPAFRVVADDGTELIASGEHRLLTERGWTYVASVEERPSLAPGDTLLGTGAFARPPTHDTEYIRAYLCGLIRGNALLGAVVDLEPLQRARAFLAERGVVTADEGLIAVAAGHRRTPSALRPDARAQVERIRSIIHWPTAPTSSWSAGFLAGLFDAEGTYAEGVLRIASRDPAVLAVASGALRRLGFETAGGASEVRLRGGLRAELRFLHTVDPATTRKRDLDGRAIARPQRLRVRAVEPLGFDLLMCDMTTGTGDFIANGVVSHNCYARPTHEYLSLGAGTDFDRTIVVKPDAPALLREAFDRRSWRGETVVFSGVTDCYQPLEASYRLTRGCLEVCAEYRNPVGIITKAPLIERDLDVLRRLHERARLEVAVSVPFWDAETARAIEPGVATPQRRLRAVEKLAAAGIPTRVMIAPIIPGLNDEDIGDVMAAAKAAGARAVGYVLVRLPGSVAAVFEERVRAALPLRAEKILRRIREARGGKLYDARFGVRERGEGAYAQAIGALFDRMAKHHGLDGAGMGYVPERTTPFERPLGTKFQLPLF